jgi:hypothetical protein
MHAADQLSPARPMFMAWRQFVPVKCESIHRLSSTVFRPTVLARRSRPKKSQSTSVCIHYRNAWYPRRASTSPTLCRDAAVTTRDETVPSERPPRCGPTGATTCQRFVVPPRRARPRAGGILARFLHIRR